MYRSSLVGSLVLALGVVCGGAAAQQLTVKSPLVRLIEHVELSAQVEGVLQAVEVREGQRVTAGQLLAQIDAGLAAVAYERARLETEVARMESEQDATVREAEKVLVVAEADWQRAQEAVARVARSVSKSQMDAYELAAEQAKLGLERARHEFELSQVKLRIKQAEADEAREKLQRHQILSPIAGVVAAVDKRVGESVVPGEKVLRVVNDELLRVEGFLETRYYQPGLTGSKAQLKFDLPGQPPKYVTGRVTFVSPENDPHNGEIRVWIEFQNSEGLFRSGMKPLASIELPTASRAVGR